MSTYREQIADLVSTSESAHSQSHVQKKNLLRYTASLTDKRHVPIDLDGPNTPMRQSTHRTGAPLPTVAQLKRLIDLELDGASIETDASDPGSVFSRLTEPNGVTRIDNARINNYLRETSLYNMDTKRWSKIPTKKLAENDLYEPFTDIIQNILTHFNFSHVSAVDTHKTMLASLEEFQMTYVDQNDKEILTKTSPDICIMGDPETSKFVPDADISKSKFRLQEDPNPSYSHCVAPVELKTDKALDTVNIHQVVLQIAVYARQCFNHQPNRRFVCGIIGSETTFRLIMFDRLGAVRTKAFNIHVHAVAFVRAVLGVSSFMSFVTNGRKMDSDLSCFDPAIEWIDCQESVQQYLEIKMPTCHDVLRDRGERNLRVFVNSKPFVRRTIRGRGTRCWLGILMEKGSKKTEVVVKESWRSEGREAEWVLLKEVANLKGVGKMLYYHQPEEGKEDKASKFRRLIFDDISAQPDNLDRIFSRVVLEAYGPTIHHFDTPLQLLVALRDAVAGHSFMWEKGILHRDVSLNNIVLGKRNAAEGYKGVLIDMDMAIAIKNYKRNSEPRTGTRAFQSVMVIRSAMAGELHPPQDHLDDLESFFHVLMWIGMIFVAARTMIDKPVTHVEKMEDWDDDTCATHKRMMLDDPTQSLTPWFRTNKIFTTLMTELGEFLFLEVKRKNKKVTAAKDDPSCAFDDLDVVHKHAGLKHHKFFIECLSTAISQIEHDESKGPDASRNPFNGPTRRLEGSGEVPQVFESATSLGQAKRARSGGNDETGAAKRAHVGDGTRAATEGISRLQISDVDDEEHSK